MGSGTSKQGRTDSVLRILRLLIEPTVTENAADLINTIEQSRALSNGLSKAEEEMYAEGLYRVSINQRMLFDSPSPNLFRVLIDLVKSSMNISFKSQSTKRANKGPLTEQEQIELLRTSVNSIKVTETDLRTLSWVSLTLETIKSEAYFLPRLHDTYLLFYYYLTLYHHGDTGFAAFRVSPKLKELSETVMDNVKTTLKYLISLPGFANFFILDSANTKLLVYLCTQSLLELAASKFIYYNDLLLAVAESEHFRFVSESDAGGNILKLYVNNTLMLLLIPELSGRRPISNLSYKGSIEYMSIILNFLSALVTKSGFAEVILGIKKHGSRRIYN